MSSQWCPFAVRMDGPRHKFGYSGVEAERYHPKRAVVDHSAEGWKDGTIGVIFGPRLASFQFLIDVDAPATLYQFYPVDADCWHCGDVDDDGGVAGNIDLVGVEHAGMAGQALTEAQYQTSLRLYRWLAQTRGWGPATLYKPHGTPQDWAKATMFEHNWVSDVYTSCPSGRIPWQRYLADLRGEQTMTQEQIELYVRRVLAGVIGALARNEPQAAANALKAYLGVTPTT
jgi:hypothetical protein